jgi:suppressor of ftsI
VPQPELKGGFTIGDYAERFYLLNGEPFFQETHANAQDNHPPVPTPTQLPVQQFKLAPGEVVRFRMLFGCSDNLMPIVVDGHELHLIAFDGVNFPAPHTVPIYTEPTGPANRAEFLIQAGKPGRYAIRELAQDQQFLSSAAKTIAEIIVEGSAKNMALPTSLPTPKRYYPLIDKVSKQRTLEFAGMFPAIKNPYVGADFTINGLLYAEEDVQQEIALGDAEEWTLKVADMDHGGTEGHPFHIHVNHFEVISIAGVPQPPGTIKDTIWIPKASDVVIRIKFKDFRGKAVYHCHILPHEDTGMMQNFLIS